MKNIKIKSSDYTRLGHAKFAIRFGVIIDAILTAPSGIFDDCPYSSEELTDFAKTLRRVTNIAGNGGSSTSKSKRDVLREQATHILNKLSAWVLTIARQFITEQQQLAIIGYSKFTPVKTTRSNVLELNEVWGVRSRWTGHKAIELPERVVAAV